MVARTSLTKQTLAWDKLGSPCLVFFVHMHSKYTCNSFKWMLVEFHATFCLNYCIMKILWFPTKGESGHMIFWTIVMALVSRRLAVRSQCPCKVLVL